MNKKIKITSVSYGRTVPTKQFESSRVDLTAQVQVGQNWLAVLEELRTECLKLEQRIKREGF